MKLMEKEYLEKENYTPSFRERWSLK